MICAELNFHQSSINPACEYAQNKFLIINQCEGYSLVSGIYDESGEFGYFLGMVAGEPVPYHPEDYSFWARLPNSQFLAATQ